MQNNRFSTLVSINVYVICCLWVPFIDFNFCRRMSDKLNKIIFVERDFKIHKTIFKVFGQGEHY